MDAVWNDTYKVNSYHVDFQKRLKPSALMQFFQESAGNHAEHLGAGYESLQTQNLFWALSRFTMDMEIWPLWGEQIHIRTWPCGTEGLFFRRDFQFFNEAGKQIGRGVSGWLLLDGVTMRPQRMARLTLDLPLNEERSMDTFPQRVMSSTDTEVFSKTILYNEIDVNLHVNNTRYLDWVMDCFDKEHFIQNTLSSFTLEFLSETLWGDEIKLFSGISELGYSIEAISQGNQKVVFKAETRWNKS